jgi:CheY-like chemotaxis protein
MLETRELLLQCGGCRTRRPHALHQSQIRQLAQGASLQLHCRFCTSLQSWTAVEPVDPARWSPKELTQARNVLLVDDDDLIRKLLGKVMETWQANIDVAENGKEAFAKLASKSYDLMICDLQMPEMNGVELFRHVRDNGLISPERIIFLTGDQSAPAKEFLDQSGCYYLYKPIQFRELSENVQEIFSNLEGG